MKKTPLGAPPGFSSGDRTEEHTGRSEEIKPMVNSESPNPQKGGARERISTKSRNFPLITTRG